MGRYFGVFSIPRPPYWLIGGARGVWWGLGGGSGLEDRTVTRLTAGGGSGPCSAAHGKAAGGLAQQAIQAPSACPRAPELAAASVST